MDRRSSYRYLPVLMFITACVVMVAYLLGLQPEAGWAGGGILILVSLLGAYVHGERRFAAEMSALLKDAWKGDAGARDGFRDPFCRELAEYMQGCLPNRSEREYKSEISSKKIELDTLQSQINPHFLYNTLDSIRGEALLRGAKEVADMTEALAMIFRYCISIRGDLVTLGDEIKNVKSYLLIQKFRFEDRFSFEIIINASDNVMDCLLPKLTLQPIVENALFHGLETKRRGGELRLRITETDRCVEIRVEDNGCGIEAERLEQINAALDGRNDQALARTGDKDGGIALINVNERLKLTFGEKYGITLYSAAGEGTTVEMTVPRQKMAAVEQSEGC